MRTGTRARSRRTAGVAATLAFVAALSIAAAPAPAKAPNSVWLTATPGKVTATTNVSMTIDYRAIYISNAAGAWMLCQTGATSCSMPVTSTGGTVVAMVRDGYGNIIASSSVA